MFKWDWAKDTAEFWQVPIKSWQMRTMMLMGKLIIRLTIRYDISIHQSQVLALVFCRRNFNWSMQRTKQLKFAHFP
jgi:hypothetical protein